ncbi:MAG: hypothetical protein R3C03_23910 [Pirellulaceae bacterium]
MSLVDVRRSLAWAVASFNRVCRIGLRIVTSGTIKWLPYHSNDFAGLAKENQIWISTKRKITDVRTMAAVMMHEFVTLGDSLGRLVGGITRSTTRTSTESCTPT